MTTSTATAYETVYPSLVKIRKPNGMGGRTNQHIPLVTPFWLSTKLPVIEFRCRGTPWVRKIATNNFGTWEMSAYNAF